MKRLFVLIAVAATVAACSESEGLETASVFTVTGYSDVETGTRTSFGTPDAEKSPINGLLGTIFGWATIRANPSLRIVRWRTFSLKEEQL